MAVPHDTEPQPQDHRRCDRCCDLEKAEVKEDHASKVQISSGFHVVRVLLILHVSIEAFFKIELQIYDVGFYVFGVGLDGLDIAVCLRKTIYSVRIPLMDVLASS